MDRHLDQMKEGGQYWLTRKVEVLEEGHAWPAFQTILGVQTHPFWRLDADGGAIPVVLVQKRRNAMVTTMSATCSRYGD